MFKTSPFTQMPLPPQRPSIQPVDKPRVEPRVAVKPPVIIQPSLLLVAASPAPIIQEVDKPPQKPIIQVADKPLPTGSSIQDKPTPVDDVPVKKPFNYKPVMIGGGILLVFLLMR